MKPSSLPQHLVVVLLLCGTLVRSSVESAGSGEAVFSASGPSSPQGETPKSSDSIQDESLSPPLARVKEDRKGKNFDSAGVEDQAVLEDVKPSGVLGKESGSLEMVEADEPQKSSETPDEKQSTINIRDNQATTVKPKHQFKKEKANETEEVLTRNSVPSEEKGEENFIKKVVQPETQLKNLISKGRDLSDHPTTTGGLSATPKYKRRMWPKTSTDMTLPATSVAWALASLKTTPRGVPQVGNVKPIVRWSTMITKPPTTQISPSMPKSSEIEDFTLSPEVSSPLPEPKEKDKSASVESPTHTDNSTEKENEFSSSVSSLNLIKPIPEDVINKNDTIKNVIEEDIKEPDSSSSKEIVVKSNETTADSEDSKQVEFENVINKSDLIPPAVTSPSSVLTPQKPEEELIEPSSLSDSANELQDSLSDSVKDTIESSVDTPSNETPTVSKNITVPTVMVSSTERVQEDHSEPVVNSTTSSEVNVSLAALTEKSVVQTVPNSTSEEVYLNVSSSESPVDVKTPDMSLDESTFSPDSELTTSEPKHKDDLISVKTNSSNIISDFKLPELNSSSPSSPEFRENETFVKGTSPATTSTVQPKEYNEVLPISEVFKAVSTQKPSIPEIDTVSTSTKFSEEPSPKQEATTSKTDELNTIDESDHSVKDSISKPNTSEAPSTMIGVLNVTEVTPKPTTSPTTSTTKFQGTMYSVNKTVHLTTKNPSKAEDFDVDDVLNTNETSLIPKDSEEVDPFETIEDRIFNSHNKTENSSKVTEEDKVTSPTTTVLPTIPTTTKPIIIETTVKEEIDNNGEEEFKTGGDDSMNEEVIPIFTQLLIQAKRKQLCLRKEDLKDSILKLFKTEKNEYLDRSQVVVHNIRYYDCYDEDSTRSDSLIPVQIYFTNPGGMFDNSLSNTFIDLLRRNPLDFVYPIKGVEKIIGKRLTLKETPYYNEGDNSTAAAIVISSIAGICLMFIAILLLVIIRKRQKGFNYGQRCTPVSLEDYSLDNISVYNSVRRKGNRASKRSYGNPAFDDPGAISHVLNFATLSNFCNNRNQINEEFSQIPTVSIKPDELPAGVENKNRFANVIPLPETRVPLRTGKPLDDKDNYINANFVKGSKGEEKFYIACQAPLAETVSDFWQMIWEHQCRLIIMMTELQEGGVEKSADYLPPSEVLDCHRVFGDLQVTLKKREVREKYVISSLQLKNLETNLWREVVHLWYLAWPHQGVPDEPSPIIALLIEARSYVKSKENNAPIVVHCSPGTGRTGTVIAIDICIRDFETKRTIDIPRVVYNIRKDRAGAVQTKDQYAFIYQVLHLYATKLTGGGLDSI